MGLAICEAEKAYRRGEIPVGAVIVKEGRLISKAYNLTSKNPIFHAEILAIMKAKPEDVKNSTLYVTLEPCIMCSGALVLARIREIVFSLPNEKFGGTYSLYQIPLDTRLNHTLIVRRGPFGHRVERLLRRFFEQKRSAI